jgi:LuxR family maltose regulon positive regulatory protein
MPHDLRELELVTWAHVRLAEGSAALVQARLESQLEILIGQGRYGSAIELRLLLTMLYCQQGLTDLAVKSLEPALALADKEGYVRVFLDAGKSFLPVLRESAARGIELEAVTILLDAFRTEGLSSIEQPHDTSSLSRPLSDRELEVLRLIAAGLSNPEIAEHLFLSVGTIKRHVHNLFIKLDVTNRVNALERARSRKIL